MAGRSGGRETAARLVAVLCFVVARTRCGALSHLHPPLPPCSHPRPALTAATRAELAAAASSPLVGGQQRGGAGPASVSPSAAAHHPVNLPPPWPVRAPRGSGPQPGRPAMWKPPVPCPSPPDLCVGQRRRTQPAQPHPRPAPGGARRPARPAPVVALPPRPPKNQPPWTPPEGPGAAVPRRCRVRRACATSSRRISR